MSFGELSAFDPRRYVVAAAANQYNWIALGGAVLFSVAFASLLPLGVALTAEALWLLTAPRLPAFRRWVEAQSERAEAAAERDAVLSTLAGLEPVYGNRYSALSRAIQEIEQLYARQPGVSRGELDAASEQLQRLSRSFLDFSRIHQRLSRFLTETPGSELEREVQTLSRSLQGEKDLGVRFTVRQALTLAQRRLQQLEQIKSTRRAVDVRLETIEKSFAYIESRVLGLGGVRDLGAEIDAIAAQVGSVAEIEAATHAAMSSAAAQTGT